MSSHRSRWPAPTTTVVAEALPDVGTGLARRVRFLTRALFVLGLCLLGIGTGLVLLILQRSSDRDEQAARLQQSFRQGICDVMDQLPAGGLLERPREKYGCGPGIPLADLPPAVQQRYAPAAPSSPATHAEAPPPTGARAPRSTPTSPTTAPTPPAPSPSAPAPPSTPPGGPGLVCGLLPSLC